MRKGSLWPVLNGKLILYGGDPITVEFPFQCDKPSPGI